MPRYEVTIPGKGTFEVNSPHELTDEQAHLHAISSIPLRGETPGADEAPKSAFERFLAPILPSTTPSDYLTGPAHAIMHPIESAKAIGSSIAEDPVGATPIVGRLKHGYENLKSGNYAGAAGNVAGLALDALMLRKAAPDVSAQVAEGVSRGAGRVAGAIGRGTEAAADVFDNPVGNLISAGGPKIAKTVGRGTQRLGSALEGLAEKSLDARTPATASRYPRSLSKEVPGSSYVESPVDQYMPNKGSVPDAGVPPELMPQPSTSLYDRYMANEGAGSPDRGVPSTESLPSATPIDRYSPNTSGISDTRMNELLDTFGGREEVKPTATYIGEQEGLGPQYNVQGGPYDKSTVGAARLKELGIDTPEHAEANAHNIERNAPYGEGAVLPSETLPTELRDAANEGLNFPDNGRTYDTDLSMILPRVPKFTFEAGIADRPGLTVDLPQQAGQQRLQSAVQGLSQSDSFAGLPTDADVTSAVSNRNATGKWSTDRMPYAEQPAPIEGDMAMPYTDFADGIDEIVNAAGPEDMPHPPTGLGRSRLTNALKAWIQKSGPRGVEVQVP
jgi:hypothetical protein